MDHIPKIFLDKHRFTTPIPLQKKKKKSKTCIVSCFKVLDIIFMHFSYGWCPILHLCIIQLKTCKFQEIIRIKLNAGSAEMSNDSTK